MPAAESGGGGWVAQPASTAAAARIPASGTRRRSLRGGRAIGIERDYGRRRPAGYVMAAPPHLPRAEGAEMIARADLGAPYTREPDEHARKDAPAAGAEGRPGARPAAQHRRRGVGARGDPALRAHDVLARDRGGTARRGLLP